MASFFDEIAHNNLRSWILMSLFIALFAFIVFIFVIFLGGGIIAFAIGLVIILLYAAFAYFMGHKVVLKFSNAKPATREEYPVLYETVEGLALAAQVPNPQIYIINDPNPNAFATGNDRKHSYVCVTTGLLQMMDNREMQGVLAHEMSHIYDNDIRFMMIAVVFAGVIGIISAFIRNMLLFGFYGGGGRRGGGGEVGAYLLIIAIVVGILAPVFALLIRLAISRRREYMADANGARMIRDPAALANALAKIKAYTEKPNATSLKSANEITASLYFSSPFTKKSLMNIFSTHPPIDERIDRLKKMY